MELLKDYNLSIQYHPEKANVVVDALSRNPSNNVATLITSQQNILEDLKRVEIEIRLHNLNVRLANLHIRPTLIEKIKAIQNNDPSL